MNETALAARKVAARVTFHDIDSLLLESGDFRSRLAVDRLFANPHGMTDEEAAVYDKSGTTPVQLDGMQAFSGAIPMAAVMRAIYEARINNG